MHGSPAPMRAFQEPVCAFQEPVCAFLETGGLQKCGWELLWGMKEPLKWTGKLDAVCSLLGSPQRCRMLRELAQSEWLPVAYLGQRAGISRTAASQHIATLKRLKVVETGVGRLYRLVSALRPAPGAEWLDFGWMRLRLGPPESGPVAAPGTVPQTGG